MDIFEAIEKRYSHKEGFLPTEMPIEHLTKIAKAGLAAPSGCNSQCVRLVILPSREYVQPLCDVAKSWGLETAPSAIAVLTDTTAKVNGQIFELEDYSAAVENMLLAVTALGYATLWLDYMYTNTEIQQKAKNVLGVPEHYHLHCVLPIGVPDGEGSRRGKMRFEERVWYYKYGDVRV